MAGNTFGTLFRLTTFGESHGPAIGGILDGCPAGLAIDFDRVAAEMARRRPGQSSVTTSRYETDEVEFLSGLAGNITLGTPIAFSIRNKDQRPSDYREMETVFRPSHADFTYHAKYDIRDPHGGGRSSARETAARVVGGAIASQLLEQFGIRIRAFVSRIGPVELSDSFDFPERSLIESNPVRCPDKVTAARMMDVIEELRTKGDTCGGIISCIVEGVPVGLGEPVFDKLSAALAGACMGINAAHGFEYGSGFAAASMNGSVHNDPFYTDETGRVRTRTNHSGGIQGGLSNGMEIFFRVAFKPVSTVQLEQETVNDAGQQVSLQAKGRHDPCVVPRAVPIVDAMTALTLADHLLLNSVVKTSNLKKIYS